MSTPKKSKRLLDAYRFPGFRPLPGLCGVFGDSHARVVRLVRRSKKRSSARAGRALFDWCAALKWQRLKPYENFAEMIDRHWDGIAAYCKPENKVSLGFVEGLNNKIRVIQRRAYGLLRRGVSAAKDPHLHAPEALKTLKTIHSIS